jgi:hypothetical protein
VQYAREADEADHRRIRCHFLPSLLPHGILTEEAEFKTIVHAIEAYQEKHWLLGRAPGRAVPLCGMRKLR